MAGNIGRHQMEMVRNLQFKKKKKLTIKKLTIKKKNLRLKKKKKLFSHIVFSLDI